MKYGQKLISSQSKYVITRHLNGIKTAGYVLCLNIITHHFNPLNAALCVDKVSGMAVNLKEVDGIKIQRKHNATCHCGAVEIELDLPDGLIDLRRCDCSMCRRRGAIAASVPLNGINILKGSEVLKLYQFNTKTAKHYFCGSCGIYTHHQRRSNPTQYGFNVACLEGVNPLKIEGIPTYDGVNHPADRA